MPAVRGLARGRTLILIDGARVSSERRVGPSATYLDPDVVEGVEVARGPGSVAYGSDALGGVISVRTRTVAPQSPFAARFSGTLGAGIPERRAGIEISDGFSRGGVLFAAHTRDVDDYDGPDGEVFNSGYADHGFLARGTHELGKGLLTAGWQSDFGRDIERPRNNSQTVRFYYPTEDSHRLTVGYDVRDWAGFSRVHVTGFAGSYAQVTDQDRFPTATTGRSIERADVSAKDYQVRGMVERLVGRARDSKRALTSTDATACARWTSSSPTTLPVRWRHRPRTSRWTRRIASTPASTRPSTPPRRRCCRSPAASAAITSRPRTRADSSATGPRRTAPVRASWRSPPAASAASARPSRSRAGSAIRCCRIATSEARQGADSSPGIPSWNPNRACSSTSASATPRRASAPRLTYYHYRIDDLIERYSTQTDFFFFRNRGRARLRGFEAEAQAELGWGLQMESAFHVARGRALDDNVYSR